MTRNLFGGTKHKKTARKSNSHNNNNIGLRKIQDKNNELYARVTKMYGNGMLEAKAHDGISYMGIIRQKFTGKKKTSNFISQGTYVLLGKREFETQLENRKMKCDILEIYDSKEVRTLIKEETDYDWNIFYIHSIDNDITNNNIDFEDDETNRGRILASNILNSISEDEQDSQDEQDTQDTQYNNFQKVNNPDKYNKNKSNNIIKFNNNDVDIDDI
jgi:initiation factor 1A